MNTFVQKAKLFYVRNESSNTYLSVMKGTICLLGCLALSCMAFAMSEPCNIVLINADDLGAGEVGAYGQQKIQTPNMDALASKGQKWTQFYSGAPVCSPSRNVLMTGNHAAKNDVQGLLRADKNERLNDLKGDKPIAAEAVCLPAMMKKAGYVTGVFGKWGLGEFGTTGDPNKHGIDEFYGYTDQRECHSFYPKFLWDNGDKIIINEKPIPGHMSKPQGEVRAEDYRSDQHASPLIVDRAVQFINKQAKKKQPFFLYYAPLEPHVALQPLQEWVDRYPTSWDEKPYRGQQGYLPHPRPRAAYAGMISQLDDQIGKIVAALRKNGLEKNSIIIVTADNGTTHDVGGVDHRFFNSTMGLRGLKGQLYEGGLRVPGIIVYPGKIRPAVIDQPAYHADIAPTLCDIAKVDQPNMTGQSLLPILTGDTKTLKNRKPMVWINNDYTGQASVRFGDMKVLRRNLGGEHSGKITPWEVYDLKNDPNEKQNIAKDHPELVKQAINLFAKEYQPSSGYPRLKYDAP